MKRVVVIGGSFTGSVVAKRLERKFSVTLIDKNEYFEFVPGILRIAVQKDYNKKIRVKHSNYLKGSKIIIGEVKEVSKKYVIVGNKKLPYDYLVIASGAKYAPSDKKKGIVSAGNSAELWKNADKLEKAKSVLIIGGGLVGVELAGEICEHYGNKKIFIVNKGETLIGRNRPKAIKKAHDFLEKRCARLLMGQEIVDRRGRVFITDKKEEFQADIAFNCIGAKSNTEFLRKSFIWWLDERANVKVNEFLQVKGEKNIFAGGDVTDIKEEKTAQAAMKHGALIARNIVALEKGASLIKYQNKVRPMVISLGKWNAIFDSKSIVFSGIFPALIKWGIKKKIILGYKLGII